MTEVNEQRPVLPSGDVLPEQLPVLPLRDSVVFPYALAPLGVGQERSITLVDSVMRGGQPRMLVLVAQKNPEIETAGPDDVYRIATVAVIQQLARRQDKVLLMVVQGLDRIRITEWTETEPFLKAKIEPAPVQEEEGLEIEARRRNLLERFSEIVQLTQSLPDELIALANNITDPVQLAYMIAGNLRIEREQAQQILEINNALELLGRVNEVVNRELEVLQIGKRIQGEAQEQVNKAQREYILRQQLQAIQKELGEEDENVADINQLREQLEKLNLPEETRREANRELSRLERLPAASPEHGIIRNYLELIISLPWNTSSGGEIDVPFARKVLNEDHYDLEKIKERILEYLAVRKLRHDRHVQMTSEMDIGVSTPEEQTIREPILCFVGPPGVGKTSLGQSIARAMGRKFARISLGGVHDEAEIRGHRRTYIGAMPGRIIQMLRRAGVNDPVFMLDEVDKISASIHGDPTAALLEVLDPEQNKDFRDNYLDVPFDLSHVLFIATANTLDTIPPPLRDRMEILELSGYTEDEKVHIAERYLLPKQIQAHGLKVGEFTLEESGIRRIIREYTREAGVRSLERQIATVARKAARMLSEGKEAPIVVGAEQIPDYLGKQRFFTDVAERTDRPGIATGLVWTPVGGEITFVEAAMVPSAEEGLILTGMLGDVMRESAQAALTYVRSNAERLDIDPHIFDGKKVHIHVPAGAIPKDGPSAGITMATAIASLATGRLVRSEVAMTGEITLRGKVLPIGGVKEKVLGAHRAGIHTIILPRRNEPDLEDLPAELRSQLEFVFVEEADEVIRTALESRVAAAA